MQKVILLFFVSFVFVGSAWAQEDESLIGHYKFEENLRDSSRLENHGAGTERIKYNSGPSEELGLALRIEGNDDSLDPNIVVIPDNDELAGLEQFTMAVWVAPQNSGAIVNQYASCPSAAGRSFRVNLDGNGRVRVNFFSADNFNFNLLSTDPIPFGEDWSHVAVVFNQGQLSVLVNGVLKEGDTIELPYTALPDSGEDLVLGATRTYCLNEGKEDWEAQTLFNGDLDDLRLYNRALTVFEIGQLAARENPTPIAELGTEDLIGRFDDLDFQGDVMAASSIPDTPDGPSRLHIFEQNSKDSWGETQVLEFREFTEKTSVSVFDGRIAFTHGSGEVLLYAKTGENSVWQQTQRIDLPEVRQVCLSGNFLYLLYESSAPTLPGLPPNSGPNPAGVAIYYLKEDSWTQIQQLGVGLGRTMDAWGSRLVVGKRGYITGFGAGTQPRIDVYDLVDESWVREDAFDPPDGFDRGLSWGNKFISLSGDRLSLTTRGPNGEGGSLAIYRKGNDGWEQEDMETIIGESPRLVSAFDNSSIVVPLFEPFGQNYSAKTFTRYDTQDWSGSYPLEFAPQFEANAIPAGALWDDRVVVDAGEFESEGLALVFPLETVPGNLSPTDLTISADSILEKLPAGTSIGTLDTTDPNPIDSFFKYELVAGDGDSDNGRFAIGGLRGDQLIATSSFDSGAQSAHRIRIRSTDVRGASIESVFEIKVLPTPKPATIEFVKLEYTYDGNPKPPFIVTDPAGLEVDLTYDGSPNPPADAGSYDVSATIVSGGYSGSADETLVINKAQQTISLDMPMQVVMCQLISNPPIPFSVNSSSGLPVELDSSNNLTVQAHTTEAGVGWLYPRQPGSVTITASQPGDDNYEPAASVERTVEVIFAFEEQIIPEAIFQLSLEQDLDVAPQHESPGLSFGYGYPIALDNNQLVIGDTAESLDEDPGRIHLYRREAPSTWVHEETYRPFGDTSGDVGRIIAAGGNFVGLGFASSGSGGKIELIFRDEADPESFDPFLLPPADLDGNRILIRRLSLADDLCLASIEVPGSEHLNGLLVYRNGQSGWELEGIRQLLQTEFLGGNEELDRARRTFGSQLATDRNLAIISSFPRDLQPENEENGTDGVVFIGNPNAGFAAGLTQLTGQGDVSPYFGQSVDIEGDVAVVGDFGDSTQAEQSGAIYIYEREAGSWTFKTTFNSFNPSVNARFGWKVAVSGDQILAAGRREVVLIRKTEEGIWEKQFTFPPPEGENSYLNLLIEDLALDDRTVAISTSNGGRHFVSVYELANPFLTKPVNEFIFVGDLSGDPDKDERTTLEEIAMGTDPGVPDVIKPAAGKLPFFTVDEENCPIINITVPKVMAQIQVGVECSSRLGSADEDWVSISPSKTTVVDQNETQTTIQMVFPPVSENQGRDFFRLVFREPET